MWTPLARTFFDESADVVAPRLLGHFLVRQTREGVVGGAIVETEAYLIDDPACHGYGGQTVRNRSMFGPPGYAYVYLIYGLHYCFNTVCRPEGCAEAVLIRAVEVTWGEARMRRWRAVKSAVELTNGPAKLCEALDIDRRLDGVDLCAASSNVYVAENPEQKEFLLRHSPMVTDTRIGITRAAERPLRFYLAGSRFVSRGGAKPGRSRKATVRGKG